MRQFDICMRRIVASLVYRPARPNLAQILHVMNDAARDAFFCNTRDCDGGVPDMPIHNSDVTKILNKTADLLEIDGANAFRVRAYREAASSIKGVPRNISEMVEAGEDLEELHAIGDSMANKIEEIVRTGSLRQFDKLVKRVPAELSEIMELPGLGPKRVRLLHEKLGIDDLEGLRAAAADGKVRRLKGLGPKTEERILRELEEHRDGAKRHRRTDVIEIAETLLAYLRKADGVKEAVRRGEFSSSQGDDRGSRHSRHLQTRLARGGTLRSLRRGCRNAIAGQNALFDTSAFRLAGRSPRCPGSLVWSGVALFHRLEVPQHRGTKDRRSEEAQGQ